MCRGPLTWRDRAPCGDIHLKQTKAKDSKGRYHQILRHQAFQATFERPVPALRSSELREPPGGLNHDQDQDRGGSLLWTEQRELFFPADVGFSVQGVAG